MTLKTTKKPLKFYLLMYLLLTVVIGGYTAYLIIQGTMQARDLWNAVVLPPLFTIVYYVMDTILLKIAKRKGKIDHEGLFLDDIARRMQASKLFGVEDFRRLKISPRFQDVLKVAFWIYQNGETEDRNLARLEKKFDRKSLEAKAMPFVLDTVKAKLKPISE
jgi:hypothetical protein